MIANKVLFNSFLRTFIAGFLVFAVSALTNLKYVDFSYNMGESVAAIIMSLICFIAPGTMAIFLLKY